MSDINFGKVAVLYGGWSVERDISLMSGQGVHQVLIEAGVDAHLFDIAHRPLNELKTEGFNRCFIALHGVLGEDGTVQGALEVLQIPYTGPGVMASSIAMDKIMTKRIWRAENIPTADWRIAHSVAEVEQALQELGAPIVAKPPHEGSTVGISKIVHAFECATAFEIASKNESSVLCEKFIKGIEVTCAIIGAGDQATALPIVEIVNQEAIYDYHNKYFTDAVSYIVPARISDSLKAAINKATIKAYQALSCRGWSRIDVMVTPETEQFYLLEINTCTGMTSHSLFPKAAAATGMSLTDLCLSLLRSANLDRKLST